MTEALIRITGLGEVHGNAITYNRLYLPQTPIRLTGVPHALAGFEMGGVLRHSGLICILS